LLGALDVRRSRWRDLREPRRPVKANCGASPRRLLMHPRLLLPRRPLRMGPPHRKHACRRVA